jgi:hypothetical protein
VATVEDGDVGQEPHALYVRGRKTTEEECLLRSKRYRVGLGLKRVSAIVVREERWTREIGPGLEFAFFSFHFKKKILKSI